MHDILYTKSVTNSTDHSTDHPMESGRLLSPTERESVIRRVMAADPEAAKTSQIIVFGWWQGELRWARNRVSLASDRRDIIVFVQRKWHKKGWSIGGANTNQIDDESLRGAVAGTKRSLELQSDRPRARFADLPPQFPMSTSRVWSDKTFNEPVDTRSALAQSLVESAEAQGMLASGYIEMRGCVHSIIDPWSSSPDEIVHRNATLGQCSMTTRHPKGVGSGWAGLSSYDWTAIDPPTIASISLDKCLRSLNPVAVEPGRYTVILEPQATFGIVQSLLTPLSMRLGAEGGGGPFALEFDAALQLFRTKLGLKIMDERITISQDPSDPILGVAPMPGLRAITYIERGVLVNMAHEWSREYSMEKLNDNLAEEMRGGFKMSGGDIPIEQMIAETKRGILVTRFSGASTADENSLLMTGFTRDGLWLIENGKIAKTIKNFRFTESPLFVLNQLESMGTPVPVFSPTKGGIDGPMMWLAPSVVPPIKARDFSFTSMIDAV